jgi:prolipoprotein diacylglyceryl transferase
VSLLDLLPGLVASIPSPPNNEISLGPFDIRYYGILVATGIFVAYFVTRRRYEAAGGDGDVADSVAFWGVLAGVVGARLAYVLGNLDTYLDDPARIVAIWQGGLAFFGGITAGAVVGILVARRQGAVMPDLYDAAAVGIPLGHAIGRWGNYFNQELYGFPTDLPWGLEIDPENRPARFAEEATFHPTFLYESLWNLATVGLLIVLDRRKVLARGHLFLVYLAMYATARFLLEFVRIDTEFRILGLSRNAIFAMLVAIGATATLIILERRRGRVAEPGR